MPYLTLTLLLMLLPLPEDARLTSDWTGLRLAAHLLDVWDWDGSWSESYEEGLRWLNRHWLLCKDAPPSKHAQRLPPQRVLHDCYDFNQAYLGHLLEQQRNYPHRNYEDTIAQTRRLAAWWSLASQAKEVGPYLVTKRLRLAELQDIDPQAFWTGLPPPYVPIHLFTPIVK